jgi:hypothetical protein
MKNHLKCLLTTLVFAVIAAGCASTKNPGEEGGKATTKNFLLRHGISGTLYNIEFIGTKAIVVAAEERGKDKIGQSSEFSNVVMSDFNKMKRCDLKLPQWSITWNFNEDGTCTIWENQRDNPTENGNAIPVEGPTLEWPPDLTEGLVAHYLLNGNAKDISGNGMDGKITGGTETRENALELDGKNWVELPQHEKLKFGPHDFSYCAWVKTGMTKQLSGTTTGTIISEDDNRRPRRMIGLDFFSDAPEGKPWLRFDVSDPSGRRATIWHKPINDSQWHHVVGVKHGAYIRLAVDGRIVDEEPAGHITNSDAGVPASIGARPRAPGGSSNPLVGLIKNVRIYNRALSAKEIKILFELEKPKAE